MVFGAIKRLAQLTGFGRGLAIVGDFFIDEETGELKNQPKVVKGARSQSPIVTDLEAALFEATGLGGEFTGAAFQALAMAADEVLAFDNRLPVAEVVTDLPLDAVDALATLTKQFGRADRKVARALRREASKKRREQNPARRRRG